MGAYSPSRNKYYSTQELYPNSLGLNVHSDRVLRFAWDWTDISNYTEGYLTLADMDYISPNRYEGYVNYPITKFNNTSDPDYGFYNCRGGCNITILNQGVFTYAQPNSKDMALSGDTPPYYVPAGDNRIAWGDSPSQDDTGGDTLEWFKGISNRGDIYDAVSVGINWGYDIHKYHLSGISCDTIIKVELPHSYSGDDVLDPNLGYHQPSPTDYTQASGRVITELEFGSNILDKFGETGQSFFLWHPMTNQIIWDMDGEYELTLDNIPDDLIFFGSSSLCPLQVPTNDIIIYKYGGYNNTQGELQVVVFYDKTMAGKGYHFGGYDNSINFASASDSIEYIHFASMVSQTMTNGTINPVALNGTVEYNEYYVYSVGGLNGTTSTDKILKYKVTSDDSSYNSQTLTSAKNHFAVGYSNTAGYFIGGTNSDVRANPKTLLNTTDKFSFADEVISAVSNIPTAVNAMGSGSNKQVSNLIYIVGGYTSTGVVDTINKYDMTTDVYSVAGGVLNTPSQSLNAKMTNNKMYIFGGDNGVDTFSTISSFELSNESVVTDVQNLMQPSTSILSSLYCRDNNSILLNGGGHQLGSPANPLLNTYEKFDCNTDNATSYLTQRIASIGNPNGAVQA